MKLHEALELAKQGKKIRSKTWVIGAYCYVRGENMFDMDSIKLGDEDFSLDYKDLISEWELYEEKKNLLDTVTAENAAWGCLIVKFNNFMVEANERIEKLERENQFLKAEWTKIKTLDDLWARIEKLENFKKEILRIEPVETLAICIHGRPAKLGCDYCVK